MSDWYEKGDWKKYDGSRDEPPYGTNGVLCPFCGEPDFDLPGLKLHLTRERCEVFNGMKPTDGKGE